MIPTEVDVRIGVDGTITPLRFSWQGSSLRIARIGRVWADSDGDHWLVMTALSDRLFELLHTPDGTWKVKPGGSRPAVA
jgi:hypothetical protein